MDYIKYHLESSRIRDIDPANDCLVYIADRFELTIEQRYWLAFLYSTCYSANTVFYIYNEFPDFANVDVKRLERWWKSNKAKCIFQTDRLRIKSNDQFVPTFVSYKNWVGNSTQQERFYKLKTSSPHFNYINAYRELGTIKNVGRFTLFIYLEMINLLTDFKCLPDKIDWKHADNCAKGLIHATGMKIVVEDIEDLVILDSALNKTIKFVKAKHKACKHTNIFNFETTLCAYAKYVKGQRYVGYYIDRQKKELEKIRADIPEGVCWRVIDEFRKETYKSNTRYLKEPI